MASSGGPPDDGTARPRLSIVPRPATEPEDARTTEIGTDEIRTTELPIEAAVRARVLAGRAAMRALASAVERGDDAAAAASWAAVGLGAQHGFSGAPAEVRRWLASRAPVQWAELYRWDDPWAASALWREGLLVRLRDERRRAEGLAMLAEPTLLADVGRDETAAELALRAVSAAAWYADAGDELLAKLADVPRTPLLDRLAAQAKLDVELGRQARAAAKTLDLPAALRRFLVEWSLLEGEARRVLVDELREDVRRELPRYLAWADGLERARPGFARALGHRLGQHVARRNRALAELPPPQRERLGERLRRLAAPPVTLAPVAVVAGVLGVVAVGVALGVGAVVAAFAVAAAVMSLALARDHLMYRRRVRQPLLAVLIELEVTLPCAVEWMAQREARGARLAAYRHHAARDPAARLVALIGAADDDDDG